MSRKIKVIVLCILLIVGVVAIARLFAPRPIVADVSESRITRVQFNPCFNQLEQFPDAIIEVTDYDEEAILECLNRYMERGTFVKAKIGFWIGDLQICIDFQEGEESRYLLLGNLDYSYGGQGTPKYYVEDAEALRAELLELLNLPPKD